MSAARPLAAGAALMLLLAGCATIPKPAGEVRDERLDALERRVLELSQQSAVAEVEITRLRQQVTTLEARLQAAQAAARSSDATAASPRPKAPAPSYAGGPVTTPTATVHPRPTGTLEESDLPDEPPLRPAPTPAPAAAKPATAPPSLPVSAGASKPKAAPTARPAATPAPRTTPPSAPATADPNEGAPVPRDAQGVYDEAYTLFHQGRYEEAEARFEEFLAQSPKSELSDNAQYWIGACRSERKDYQGALAAFRRTVELYPDANKVPDALYKIGECLERLDQPDQALEVYDELVKRFPDTAAGTLGAERRLKLRGSD